MLFRSVLCLGGRVGHCVLRLAKDAGRWSAEAANYSESGRCGNRFAIEWSTEPGFLPAGSCGGKVRGNCCRASTRSQTSGRTGYGDTVPATPACIDVRLTNGVRSFVPCTDGGRVMLTCPTHLPIDIWGQITHRRRRGQNLARAFLLGPVH